MNKNRAFHIFIHSIQVKRSLSCKVPRACPWVSTAEIVGCYDYEEDKAESFKYLFQAAFGFIFNISKRWGSKALTSNLQEMLGDAPWLATQNGMPNDDTIEFIHNLDIPLWQQITSRFAKPVDAIYVLSRYFDSTPKALDILHTDLQPTYIEIFTQNGITTMTEEWLKHPLVKNGTTEIMLCEYKDGEHIQHLHAKAIAIRKGSEFLFGFGSANFTSPAMFNVADKANVEVLLLIHRSTEDITELQRVFDPCETAFHLNTEGILQSSSSEEEDFEYLKYDIMLFEAMLVGDKIWLQADIPTIISPHSLYARMTFYDETYMSLSISHEYDDSYCAIASQDIIRRLGQSSTVVQVEAWKDGLKTATSNGILITNLIDIQTGQGIRQERHIKEAQQSAVQFFAVLRDLIEWGDEAALIVFLNYCDIPVTDALRPIFARGMRPIWEGGKGMRKLGERNLMIFSNLHDAAIHFFDIHLGKLQRHIEYGGINGIANFMHIFLAMGGILRAQIERAIQGFETMTRPISNHEWFTYRGHLETYFMKFQTLLHCLCVAYLTNMIKTYDLDEIKERLQPDLLPLHDLCSDIIGARDRIELLRISNLKVMTPNNDLVNPPYYSCILSNKQWPSFVDNIKAMLNKVRNAVST